MPNVTFRLSDDELMDLQRKASNAGVNISTYLRDTLDEVRRLRGEIDRLSIRLYEERYDDPEPPRGVYNPAGGFGENPAWIAWANRRVQRLHDAQRAVPA